MATSRKIEVLDHYFFTERFGNSPIMNWSIVVAKMSDEMTKMIISLLRESFSS